MRGRVRIGGRIGVRVAEQHRTLLTFRRRLAESRVLIVQERRPYSEKTQHDGRVRPAGRAARSQKGEDEL